MTGIGRPRRGRGRRDRPAAALPCTRRRPASPRLGSDRTRSRRRSLKSVGGVAAEVAGLECRVGDRRALRTPLDHGEQQVGVGVALRRVQHVVHIGHRGGDAHRPDVRRSLVGPDRRAAWSGLQQRAPRERPREQFGEIGRLLVALDRREQQLDRPLGGQALGLQRVGEAEAADDEVGPCRAAAVELASTSWPSLDVVPSGSNASSRPRCWACR
jgi:hypothetical protein